MVEIQRPKRQFKRHVFIFAAFNFLWHFIPLFNSNSGETTGNKGEKGATKPPGQTQTGAVHG